MILEIKDLNVTYNSKSDNPNAAVRGVSFALEENSFSGLIGESGSGKSTVIMTLLGLLPRDSAASGEILYKGRSILGIPEDKMASLRQREIALIPQGALNSFTPVMTIGRHLREVLELHLGLKGEAAERRITELLVEVELPPEIAARYPHELSGGQKQRAAIAIALSCEPKLVLADEPTTALDVTVQAQILELMKDLQKKWNTAIILITHDLGVIAGMADRVAVMYSGHIVEEGTRRHIFYHPAHPYTQGLLKSVPNPDNLTKERLVPIKGQPPDLLNPPKGCPYALRCPKAMRVCLQYPPETQFVEEGHSAACWLQHAPHGGDAR